jgi:leader peptidase (prepilin peptidase)/N-methyltransferase
MPGESGRGHAAELRDLKRVRMGTDVYVAIAASAGAAAPASDGVGRRWSVPVATAPVAAGAALLAVVRLGATGPGLLAAGLLPVLVVLAAIDLRCCLVPNRIVFPAFCVVLAFQLAVAPEHAAEWLAAAACAPLVMLMPAIVDRRAVGMGDVKLAALLGAALGEKVLVALLIGSVAVIPVAAVMLARGGLAARRSAIPFAPFLALGAAAALLG